MNNEKKLDIIAIVGLGYVGLPVALQATKKGYQVIGIDHDKNKIRKIKDQISPFEDELISQELKNSPIQASSDWSRISEAKIVIICVPTPVDSKHQPDLGPIKDSSVNIGKNMSPGTLVILESTVNPGICDEVIIPILEENSGLICGIDFNLAHCPERINPGDKKWNVGNIPRVIGGFNNSGLEKGLEFYQSIIDTPIKPMKSLREAEAVKIVENSFRDINIAFVNELAQSFTHLGIDVINVIEGAATKPFSFMAHYPGCGVGGHCIPVDPYYLIEEAKKSGFKHRFLALARQINNDMPLFTTKLVEHVFEDKGENINGMKVAVLGLSYKPNIGDSRESPSFEIIKHLKKHGARVFSYDPHIEDLSTADNLIEAVHDAKVVVICTAHDLFKSLTPKFFLEHNVYGIVDGRNCLPGENFVNAGITYVGIGRHHVFPGEEKKTQIKTAEAISVQGETST